MSSARANCSGPSFSFAASTQATAQPSARSQAAADASPNGCRPISYVLIRSALPIDTIIVFFGHGCCRGCAALRSRVLLPPPRPLDAVLHRDVGALQLLRDAGLPGALHGGAGHGRRSR